VSTFTEHVVTQIDGMYAQPLGSLSPQRVIFLAALIVSELQRTQSLHRVEPVNNEVPGSHEGEPVAPRTSHGPFLIIASVRHLAVRQRSRILNRHRKIVGRVSEANAAALPRAKHGQ
jgi:hypothetical protein